MVSLTLWTVCCTVLGPPRYAYSSAELILPFLLWWAHPAKFWPHMLCRKRLTQKGLKILELSSAFLEYLPVKNIFIDPRLHTLPGSLW